MKKIPTILIILWLAGLSATPLWGQVRITVQTQSPAHAVSPLLYGLFFEDINFAADGGLYAEQVQNRSFEFAEQLFGWQIESRQADGVTCDVLDQSPIHPNNPHYLRVSIAPDSAVARLSNEGFGGIVLRQNDYYLYSIHARAGRSFKGTITVGLIGPDGQALGQSQAIEPEGRHWRPYRGRIRARSDQDHARLTVTVNGSGQVDLDMISLFPEKTWKRQPNGLRADLVAFLKELKPAFLRFPGGCIVEGKDLANAYRWKDTIGDPAERKVNWNRWSGWKRPPQYYQSYGLGFYEYFRLCEDLGAEPVPILNCGMSCQFQDAQLVALDELDPFIQDALDLIEYANGPADSRWGSKRAAAGHPEPFNLKMLGIGNEQWDEPYFERYAIFYKVIKERYPDIQIITTSGPGADGKWYDLAWNKFKSGTPAEIVDEHYYRSPQWFLQNDRRYDSFDRNGPKIFAGEYAAHGPGKRNTLFTALAEAAFITGLERNSDIVIMASYAPLLAKVGSTQWTPDLIFFDNTRIYGTPSYYVQKLFSHTRGDWYLATTVTDTVSKRSRPGGRIGLCTWRTAAEFKDVTVRRSGQTLMARPDRSRWQARQGQWQFDTNHCVQTDTRVEGAICYAGETNWSDYTLSLKARKTGGNEGFIICFRRDAQDDGLQWNLGGWGNTRHAIQAISGGVGSVLTETPGRIETGRWYDIEIRLKGEQVSCLLDGRLVHELTVPVGQSRRIYASATRSGSQLYVKAVNPTAESYPLTIELAGSPRIAPRGSVIVLSADDPQAENSLDQPRRVFPREKAITGLGGEFNYEMAPYTLAIFKLKQL